MNDIITAKRLFPARIDLQLESHETETITTVDVKLPCPFSFGGRRQSGEIWEPQCCTFEQSNTEQSEEANRKHVGCSVCVCVCRCVLRWMHLQSETESTLMQKGFCDITNSCRYRKCKPQIPPLLIWAIKKKTTNLERSTLAMTPPIIPDHTLNPQSCSWGGGKAISWRSNFT